MRKMPPHVTGDNAAAEWDFFLLFFLCSGGLRGLFSSRFVESVGGPGFDNTDFSSLLVSGRIAGLQKGAEKNDMA